jgi:hypothetical protein
MKPATVADVDPDDGPFVAPPAELTTAAVVIIISPVIT